MLKMINQRPQPEDISQEEKRALIEDILRSGPFRNAVKGDIASKTLSFLFNQHLQNKTPNQRDIADGVYGPEAQDRSPDRGEKVRHSINRLRRRFLPKFFNGEGRYQALRLEIPLSEYSLKFFRFLRPNTLRRFTLWDSYVADGAELLFGLTVRSDGRLDTGSPAWFRALSNHDDEHEDFISFDFMLAYHSFARMCFLAGRPCHLMPRDWELTDEDMGNPDWFGEEQRYSLASRLEMYERKLGQFGPQHHFVILGHPNCMVEAKETGRGIGRLGLFGQHPLSFTMFTDPSGHHLVSVPRKKHSHLLGALPSVFSPEDGENLVLLSREFAKLTDNKIHELTLITGSPRAVGAVCQFITSESGQRTIADRSEFIGFGANTFQILFAVLNESEEGETSKPTALDGTGIVYVHSRKITAARRKCDLDDMVSIEYVAVY